MTQTEPIQHTKSDGTSGPMEVRINMDTAAVTEAAPAAPAATVAPAGPQSLELAPVADPSRPAWLESRFQTPEALAAAYKELERKLGQPAQPSSEKPAGKVELAPAIGIPPGLTDAELQAYSREVLTAGNLSEASFAALAARGIPKALAEAHVDGLLARREKVEAQALQAVGGREGYAAVAEWARGNLTPAEQSQYNADVNSGDPARVQYAVTGLKARHDAANQQPANGRLVHGRRATTASTRGFTSMDEQVAAMQDPRYLTNPAYRNEVEKMVRESTGY